MVGHAHTRVEWKFLATPFIIIAMLMHTMLAMSFLTHENNG